MKEKLSVILGSDLDLHYIPGPRYSLNSVQSPGADILILAIATNPNKIKTSFGEHFDLCSQKVTLTFKAVIFLGHNILPQSVEQAGDFQLGSLERQS
jgi:hypothetical protein